MESARQGHSFKRRAERGSIVIGLAVSGTDTRASG
jgi:hypothetical protein